MLLQIFTFLFSVCWGLEHNDVIWSAGDFHYSSNIEKDHRNANRYFVLFTRKEASYRCDDLLITITAGNFTQRRKVTQCDTLSNQKFTIFPSINYNFELIPLTMQEVAAQPGAANKTTGTSAINETTNSAYMTATNASVYARKQSSHMIGYELLLTLKGTDFNNLMKLRFGSKGVYAIEADYVVSYRMTNKIIYEIHKLSGINESFIHVYIQKPNGLHRYGTFYILIESQLHDATAQYTLEKIRSLREIDTNENGEFRYKYKSGQSLLLRDVVRRASVLQVTEIEQTSEMHANITNSLNEKRARRMLDASGGQTGKHKQTSYAYFFLLFFTCTIAAVLFKTRALTMNLLKRTKKVDNIYQYVKNMMRKETIDDLQETGFEKETFLGSCSPCSKFVDDSLKKSNVPKELRDEYVKQFTDAGIDTRQQLQGMNHEDWEKLQLPKNIELDIRHELSLHMSDISKTMEEMQRFVDDGHLSASTMSDW